MKNISLRIDNETERRLKGIQEKAFSQPISMNAAISYAIVVCSDAIGHNQYPTSAVTLSGMVAPEDDWKAQMQELRKEVQQLREDMDPALRKVAYEQLLRDDE